MPGRERELTGDSARVVCIPQSFCVGVRRAGTKSSLLRDDRRGLKPDLRSKPLFTEYQISLELFTEKPSPATASALLAESIPLPRVSTVIAGGRGPQGAMPARKQTSIPAHWQARSQANLRTLRATAALLLGGR